MGRVAAINIGLIQIDQAGFSSFFTYLMIFQSGGMLFEKSSTPYGASKIWKAKFRLLDPSLTIYKSENLF